mgnify:CR=1 FL=1
MIEVPVLFGQALLFSIAILQQHGKPWISQPVDTRIVNALAPVD